MNQENGMSMYGYTKIQKNIESLISIIHQNKFLIKIYLLKIKSPIVLCKDHTWGEINNQLI